MFYVFWFIVGNVLYFVANGCGNFQSGYDLTLALISMHYIVCGVVYVAFFGNMLTFLIRLAPPDYKKPNVIRVANPTKDNSIISEAEIYLTTT